MISSSANLVLRGSNQTLKLEPELFSFDPDGVSQVVGFTWWCKKKSEEWTDSIQTGVSIPSVEKEGEDLGGCFGDGPSKFDYDKGSLELPCHLFKEIPGYYTMLGRGKVTSDEKIDPRKRNATLDLEIVPGSPPVLTASCNPEKSCTFIDGVVSVNPIKLVLRSSCVVDEGNESQDRQKTIDLGDDGCGKPPVSYEWVMTGKTMLMMRRNFCSRKWNLFHYWCEMLEVFTMKRFAVFVYQKQPTIQKQYQQLQEIQHFRHPFSNDTDSFSPFQSPYHRDNTSFHIIYDYSNINFTNGKNYSEDPFWSDEEGEVVHVAALTDEVKVDCPHWVDREGRGVKRYKISIESTSGRKTPLWSGNQFPAIITLPYDDIRLIGEIFDDQEAVAVFNFKEKISMHLPDKHIYDCYDNSSTLSEAQKASANI
ncbi:hypothetical protein Avbf_10714 [Armadillidium vulgare]|nr:hypothetical protein Avbf_10714 [Armadillidium vulgare]